MAAVSVVLPWSTCPIVPTLICGLVRSNFCLAMALFRASSRDGNCHHASAENENDPLRSDRRVAGTSEGYLTRTTAESDRKGCSDRQGTLFPIDFCHYPQITASMSNLSLYIDLEPMVGFEPTNLVFTKDALCQLSYMGLWYRHR